MSISISLKSGAIGLDFGSSRTVLAVAQQGGVDILINEASLRETKNIVGYGPIQRFTGEAANSQAKSNFKNTIAYFNRFLGLPQNYPLLKEEIKWISSQVTKNGDNKIAFEVNYKNNNVLLLPEQVTAAMIGDIRKIITSHNLPNEDAVISVPSYYTEQERKALIDSCKIAGLNPLKLLNECTAICLSYGVFRKQELDALKPRYVAFVDFGHSKFSCFVGEFFNDKFKIISQVHERNLGVRDIDWEIYQYFSQKFDKKYGLSVSDSKKSKLRLLDAIEKMRKILSANTEADCNCEYLMEDCDLNENMTRDAFESIAQPILTRIKVLIEEVNKDLKIKNIKIHSVEIVGGAVRIPIVQYIIQQAFKIPSLNKTLNQSECIARGCALMADIICSGANSSLYSIEEQNYYPINIKWNYFNFNEKGDKINIDGKSSVLFEKGCEVSKIKAISFSKNDSININIFYSKPPLGFSSEISQIVIGSSQPKELEFGVKIKIKFNKHGLIHLDEAQLIEDYIYEEKIPIQQEIPPLSNSEQEASSFQNSTEGHSKQQESTVSYEIKKKKKTRYTDLKLEYESEFYQLSNKILVCLTNLQQEHVLNDQLTITTLHKKNELESYIYSWNSKLASSHKSYISNDNITLILQQLKQTEDWLCEVGNDSTLKEYTSQLLKLQNLCSPIEIRFNEYLNLPDSISMLNKAIIKAQNLLNSCENSSLNINDEARNLEEEIKELKMMINDYQKLNSTRDRDPIFTCSEIQSRTASLEMIQDALSKKLLELKQVS